VHAGSFSSLPYSILPCFLQALNEYIEAYMNRNMWDSANSSAILEALKSKLSSIPNLGADDPSVEPLVTVADAQQDQSILLNEFADVASAGVLPHQQPIYDSILSKNAGLVCLSGAGGAGKSHVLKCLTHAFRQANRTVSISATTARAARNLSVFGRTIHSAFGLAVRSFAGLTNWAPFSPEMLLIKKTDVFIIDEMSMLTQQQLFYIMLRIMGACGYKDIDEMLTHKLIILTGDLFQVRTCVPWVELCSASINPCFWCVQLPPVCRCRRDGNDESTVCKSCHLTASTYWDQIEKFDIEGSVRHNLDPVFGQFCATIRKDTPTQQQIDEALSGCKCITKNDIPQHAAPTSGAGANASDLSTVLCTHNKDVNKFNTAIIKRLHGHAVTRVPMDFFVDKTKRPLSSAPDSIKPFLEKPGFHRLNLIAEGAPVIYTTNTHNASNSDAGTVFKLHMEGSYLKKISVRLEGSGKIIRVSRTVSECIRFDQVKYTKFTFPLVLGYAMTAHKAQGLTITKPVILDAEGAFEAGQMYVLFSRVTKASLLTVCGTLQPALFKPVKIRGLNC